MSGQPDPSRADLASGLALLQPKLIAERLLGDTAFLAEFGTDARRAVSIGGCPALLKSALYEGTRALFRERRPQTLAALTGEQLTISLGKGAVEVLSRPGAGEPIVAHSPNLMLLSPEPTIRRAALDAIAAALGPTGPDPEEWGPRLTKAPLDDSGMDDFWRQVDASLPRNIANIVQDLRVGLLNKQHLIPRSLDYWAALCGRPSLGMDQENWLKDIFLPHRRRLIDRDLPRGLDICLPMYLRDDLTLRPCTAGVSNDALWSALQQLQPIDDPFSLLAVLDLAVARADDQRFAELAARVMERVCAEQLERADGLDVYAFLPALVDLVQAELRVLPNIAGQPAYWRRLCAWTQAGLLVRVLQPLTFDVAQLTGAIEALWPKDGRMAELLDLPQSPLSHPSETSGICIYAEVLGRLQAMRQRNGVGRDRMPAAGKLTAALTKMAEKAPMLASMPGPLELDQLPYIEWDQLSDEIRAGFNEHARALTSNLNDPGWAWFARISRAVRLEPRILTRMTGLIAEADLRTSDADRRAPVGHLMAVAYLAVAQQSAELADAILTRCVQSIGPSTDDGHAHALVMLGLIASAAFGIAQARPGRLGRYLTELAAALPQRAPCHTLATDIAIIRRLTPSADWPCLSRADAVASLGS